MSQHYFVVAWDESKGWFIDQDMAENIMGDDLFYDDDACQFSKVPEDLCLRDASLYSDLSKAFETINKGE
jgi:hypothetical protein